MSRITLFFACLLCFSFSHAQNLIIDWSTPIDVATDNFDNTRPRIVLADGNVPVVMWGNAGSSKVYAARWNGSGFGTPVVLNPSGVNAFVANWVAPDIGGYGDTLAVVFKRTPVTSRRNYAVMSYDGGQTWGDTVRIEDMDTLMGRYPAVEVLSGGEMVATFMRMTTSYLDPEYVAVRSTDGGMSWSQPVPVSEDAPGETCDCCPSGLASDGDRVVSIFRNNDSDVRDIWVSVSENRGQSFDTLVDADANNWVINTCPSSGPSTLISGDSLISVWMSGATGPKKVNMGILDLGTYQLIRDGQISASTGGQQDKPRVAGRGDSLCVVFEDTRGGTLDIYYSCSATGASDLIGNSRLGLPAVGGIQRNPDVAYAGGVFHMVYQDDLAGTVKYRYGSLATAASTDAAEEIEMEVWPVPAQDRLFIRANVTTGSYRLRDVAGRLLTTGELRGGAATVQRANMAAGVYLLELETPSGTAVRKVVWE